MVDRRARARGEGGLRGNGTGWLNVLKIKIFKFCRSCQKYNLRIFFVGSRRDAPEDEPYLSSNTSPLGL
jgi:hypothetical protein